MRHACRALLAVVLLVGTVGDADAQVLGIRVTPTGSTGLMVNVDVNVLATTGYPFTTIFIGVISFFGSPLQPAIEWGDGNTVAPWGYGTTYPGGGIPLTAVTTFSGTPVRSYRGSFSHTYAAAGTYTITGRSYAAATTPLLTGNLSVTSIYGYPVATNQLAVTVPLPPVPSLPAWGLVLLALLLGTAGWYQLRGSPSGSAPV